MKMNLVQGDDDVALALGLSCTIERNILSCLQTLRRAQGERSQEVHISSPLVLSLSKYGRTEATLILAIKY